MSPAETQCDRSRVSKGETSQVQLMPWEDLGFHDNGEAARKPGIFKEFWLRSGEQTVGGRGEAGSGDRDFPVLQV